MRTPRVIVPQAIETGAEVQLPAGEAAHIARVLRRRAGDELRLIALNGLFAGTVLERSGDARAPRVAVAVGDALSEVARIVPWTIAVAVVKRGAFDEALRAASELGLERVVPILASRSVKRPDAAGDVTSRWRRIAWESAKQCDRRPVEVTAPVYFEEWARSVSAGAAGPARGSLWMAVPGAPPPDIERLRNARATFAVGPEGGFEPGEVELAEAHGFQRCGFPTPILRTPTAVALIGALGVLAGKPPRAL